MEPVRMIAVSKARAKLSDLADDPEPTLLLRHSAPRAVLVPYATWVELNVEIDALKQALARATTHQAQPIDAERNARILSEVLDLAESLPYRPRRHLAFPPLRRGGR